MANKTKYRSVSISEKNTEELKAIAAQLTDQTGINHSIDNVETVLIRLWKESQ